MVKKWDKDKAFFYVKDKTALFRFDNFDHPVVRDFAWALDYASKNGIKNFVIDIATNGGGDECISHFINTIITNKQKKQQCYNHTDAQFSQRRYSQQGLDDGP